MARKKQNTLQSLRDRLSVLAAEANKAASQLADDNYAKKEAFNSLSNYRQKQSKKTGELFRGNLRTLKDIQREFARIDSFNANWKSTPEGDNFYRQERLSYYEGAFGGHWMAKSGETFDTNRINKEFAEKAFSLYDRLVEEYQSEDRASILWNKDSKVNYGSENMIIAIYDMLIQGANEFDVMNFARRRMEQNYVEIQNQNNRQLSSDDYEILSEDRYNKREVRRNAELYF